MRRNNELALRDSQAGGGKREKNGGLTYRYVAWGWRLDARGVEDILVARTSTFCCCCVFDNIFYKKLKSVSCEYDRLNGKQRGTSDTFVGRAYTYCKRVTGRRVRTNTYCKGVMGRRVRSTT